MHTIWGALQIGAIKKNISNFKCEYFFQKMWRYTTLTDTTYHTPYKV